MQVRLNDAEIRQALAEAMAKKVDFGFEINPEDCWFAVKAGEINGDEVDDIHDVEFCYKTD
jgi:hypothetical protein